MSKLSIITINYNDAIGLRKTIESVVSQSFRDFEYIIIDGGSSDNSKNVILEYQSKITNWVSEKDNGIYNAMNKGILKARGEYCLFLNSGDFLVNQNVLQSVLSHPTNADIIYGNIHIDWGNNITQGKMPNKITFEQMYLDTLWHPVSFIKRNLFEKFGFYNESYKIVADYDFFFNVIIMKSVLLSYVDIDISVYNVNGLSSKPENKILERAERKKVVESYLTPSIIEFANTYCVKDNSNNSFIKKIKHLFR